MAATAKDGKDFLERGNTTNQNDLSERKSKYASRVKDSLKKSPPEPVKKAKKEKMKRMSTMAATKKAGEEFLANSKPKRGRKA
jgi:hypothetical protein